MSLDVCKNLKHLLIITFWWLLAISATGKKSTYTLLRTLIKQDFSFQKATACDDVIWETKMMKCMKTRSSIWQCRKTKRAGAAYLKQDFKFQNMKIWWLGTVSPTYSSKFTSTTTWPKSSAKEKSVSIILLKLVSATESNGIWILQAARYKKGKWSSNLHVWSSQNLHIQV